MFTGLIEAMGVVERIAQGAMTELSIRSKPAEPYVLGESIAVDGCCLTVVEFTPDTFRTQASPETLRRTSLARLAPGTRVNLERSLKVGERLGGHLVQGHVDAVTQVIDRRTEGGSVVMSFKLPPSLAPFFVEKGSVTVDGVSLTVNGVAGDCFHVALIPETLARTTLGGKRPGDGVNLEADVIGKYVARLYGLRQEHPVSEETLRAAGFGAKE